MGMEYVERIYVTEVRDQLQALMNIVLISLDFVKSL
jgi:hypothetical protein